jgi:hypothetical protein
MLFSREHTHRGKIATRQRLVIVGLGLWLTPVQMSEGQQAGTSTSVAQPQLRVQVVSKVTRGCGAIIQPAGMQSHAEGLLKPAGITVSNIYNSQLAVNTDCVPLRLETDTPGMAVSQCLTFLEVGAPSAAERRTGLTTKWRKCESLKCSRSKCEALVHSRLDILVNMFLAEVRMPMQAPLASVIAPPIKPSPSHPVRVSPPRVLGTIFYSLHILFCLVVFLYWQLRGQMF